MVLFNPRIFVNIIARMGFEFTYYNVAVQLVNHCTMVTTPRKKKERKTEEKDIRMEEE